MYTYLLRARSKKGFTIMELIVVIAIIGVLSAVAVPSLIASQRRGEAARQREYARGFYFAVQATLTDTMQHDNTNKEFSLDIGVARHRRITTYNDPSGAEVKPITGFVAPTDYFFIYAEMQGNNITMADLKLTSNGNYASGVGVVCAAFPAADPANPTHNEKTFAELLEGIRGLSAESADAGFYYAMFDSNFRVVMAYHSKFANRAAITAIDGAFAEDYRLTNGNTFGAFPVEYSFATAFNDGEGAAHAAASHKWFQDIIPGI